MSTASVTIPGERETFAAYICDEMSSQILLPIITDRGWSPDMIFSGGIPSAVRALGAMRCPQFLIVDLSESSDPRGDIYSLAEVCEEGTVVLALGTINDVTLYRDLLQAGVHDYLVKPLTAEVLRNAIDTAEDAMSATVAEADDTPVGDGKQIVVAGVRGGLGSSTVATNIAWMKAERGEKTLLLDLDLNFGTSAMQFDLEPGRGLADAIENPGRVDGLFLERAVVKPYKYLSVLGSEAPIGSVPEPADGALGQLIASLGESFQNVIVDVPRTMIGHHADILAAATDIILVTDQSLTAARDCIRLMAFVRQVAPAARVHVVIGKAAPGQQEVEVKDFENSIEHAIDVVIPFDAKSQMAAAQAGKMVSEAAPGSKVAAAYRDLVGLFGDDTEDKAKKTSWFGKFLRK